MLPYVAYMDPMGNSLVHFLRRWAWFPIDFRYVIFCGDQAWTSIDGIHAVETIPIKQPIWEWVIEPIFGKLGDGLLVFYPY